MILQEVSNWSSVGNKKKRKLQCNNIKARDIAINNKLIRKKWVVCALAIVFYTNYIKIQK